MYCGKRKVALYIHRLTAQILCLTRGLLQNATRVCVCVCACVCVCVCVCVCDNSKSALSRNIKLEYIVGYENISDKFDNGHGWIKVKVTVGH